MNGADSVADKGPEAFRTISEVAEELDVPQHVLRFWETRFNQIRPLKRAGGRRYYRPDDVDLLRGIRRLLYGQGFTIRGVQKILREQGVRRVIAVGRGDVSTPLVAEDDDALVADDAGEAEAPMSGPEGEDDREDIVPDVAPGERIPRDVRLDDEVDHRSSSPFRFLERLKGEGKGDGQLSRDDFRQLQATLFDLIECKRMLDQAR